MKNKILSLFLCFAMLASMLSGSFMYASAYEQGDVNGDGVLDLHDVVMIQSSLGKYAVEGDPLDMNGDGVISVLDLAQLINCIGFKSGSADGSEYAGDGVYWELVDGVLTVYGSGAIKDWSSESNMPWYNVRKNISKIVIEEGIAGIGYGAFADCYNVTEVVLPETLNYIGDFAFAGISGNWKSLKEIKIPRRVTSIGDYVFYNGLAGEENYINTISGYKGSYAEQYAFDNGISFIYEDNSSSTGGGGGGPVLMDEGVCGDNITWALDIEGLLKISGSGAMTNYASAAEVPWSEYADVINYLWIEDGITSIGDFAFSGCVSLSNIQIPETVSVIGRDAFRNCDSVVELFIPANVKTIKAYTFAECDNLQYLSVEEGVYAISGYGAFYKCQNLLSAEIPATVKTIGSDVFYGCKVLTIYGESGSYAETYAANKGIDFESTDCPELPEIENMYADLTIDDITVTAGESFSVPAYASIWGVSEIECIVSYDNSCLLLDGGVKPGNMPYSEMITGSAIAPMSVTFFNGEGFNCSGELMYLEFTAGTNSGTFPVTVAYTAKNIYGEITENNYTFHITVEGSEEPEPPFIPEEYYAELSIEDITVTAGERFNVPIYATVSGIKQLDLSVSYPNTVLSMADYPIEGELPVSTMAWDDDLTANPYWVSSKTADALTGSGMYATLQLEAGMVPGIHTISVECEAYDASWEKSTGSFSFNVTVEPAPVVENKCGDNLTWTLDETGTLTISGEGDMWDCEIATQHYAPWYSIKDTILSVRIEEGVTGIGRQAFYGLTNLGNVEFSDSVHEIRYGAFAMCPKLSYVEIPGTVTNIKEYAFRNCTGLTSVKIADGVTFIGRLAFLDCTSLTSVEIPESVSEIGSSAFNNCPNLTVSVYAGSYAESYAANNSIPFVSIGGDVPDPDPEPEPEPVRGTYTEIKDVIVRPGEVATVPVFASLEDMYGMEYKFSYDSALSIYQKPVQTGFDDFDMTSGGKLTSNPYRVILDAMDTVIESGNVMEMYFRAPSEPGRYTVNVNFVSFNDYVEEDVEQDVSFDIIVKPTITAGELTVGNATARPGETVEIPISLESNPGVGYMEAIVKCADWLPEGVTVDGVRVGEAFSDMAFSWEYYSAPSGDILLKWNKDVEGTDCLNDGAIAYIILSVNDAAPEGAYDLPVEVVTMENEDAYINLDMFFGGYIEIIKYEPGDINGDTKLNVRDIVTLRRYIAGGFEGLTYIESLLDVNGDGKYNVRDVVALRKLIAG